MPLSDSELNAVLDRQIGQARDMGLDAQTRKEALDYYFGRPRGDELPGRSAVQSMDVADMVEAVLAQVLPSFVGDRVCEFEPLGPQDDAQARLESDLTNRVMMESSRGYVVFYEAIKDALLCSNGIIKAWVQKRQYGKGRELRMAAVDPVSFIVSADHDCILLWDAPFVAEEKHYTRGELLAMGYDRQQVGTLPLATLDSEDQLARQRLATDWGQDNTGWANERVRIWECYSRLDRNEDGEAELLRVIKGDGEILEVEETDHIPYAAGAAFLQAHQFQGISLYQKLKSVQDIKTAALRQYVDNLVMNNHRRLKYVEGAVNLDDLLNSRPGGVIGMRQLDAVGELELFDSGPSSQNLLNYMDKIRSERGGAALDLQAAQLQLYGDTATGIERQMTSREQLAGMMARTLAETLIRSAFALVHRLLRTELREELSGQYAGQWITQNPAKWPARDRINIKAGLSPGERMRKAQNLGLIVQAQAQALANPSAAGLVTARGLYAALMDWAAASDIDNPGRYFNDPQSPEAQQIAGQQAQGQQQTQAMLMQFEQAKLQLEQAKLQLDKAQSDAEIRFKYWDAQLKAEIEEAKLVGQATADLQLEQIRGRNAAMQPGGSGDSARSGPNGGG